VTGANRGIGFEVCRQLAGKDFVVLLTARDLAKAKAAADKLKSAGVIEPVVLDVGDASSIKHAAAEVERRYGRLDVLINNAGINYDTWESAEKADIDGTVMETVATNLLGPWRACQAFLPLLRKSRAGRIVNVSSESGSLAQNGCWSICVSGHEGCPQCSDAHACRRAQWNANPCKRRVPRLGRDRYGRRWCSSFR
jgi:NAD(P)-dependent dehydrogenase (short-subunit alcohol dehydrogenase family)